MKNIVLIGMPGTGKSTVGQVLARRLHAAFLDVDDLIRQESGKPLPELLRTDGLEEFLAVEEQIGRTLERENTVIATGGSMVLSPAAMEHLRKNGLIVWLETPLSTLSRRLPEDLEERGIAAPSGSTLREIYESRAPLYARYADLIIPSREGENATALAVEQVMRTLGLPL